MTWYQVGTVSKELALLADKYIPIDHCGTHIPGWLSGTHPTTMEGVVLRKVCHSWSNSCCYWFDIIRIKNCGAYFVYEVPRRYYWSTRFCGNGRGGKFIKISLIISVISQNIKLLQ